MNNGYRAEERKMDTVGERVRFQADWGGANLSRAAGWLAQWLWANTEGRIRSMVLNGRGQADNVRALRRGEVDIALATPAAFAAFALEGTGPFAGEPFEELRGLAVLPHRDAMLAVARADLGLRHLSDIANLQTPLRISLGAADTDSFMGLAGDVLLEAAGVDLEAFVADGGTIIRHEEPFPSIDDLREGRADIMISEAIMTPAWQVLGREADVTYLELSAAEEQYLLDRWSLRAMELEAGRFPGQDTPLRVMEFAGWAILTTTALDDEVATLIAEAIVRGAAGLERHYGHLPVNSSPLTYPIDYRKARETIVPLHPAAQQVYDAAGI